MAGEGGERVVPRESPADLAEQRLQCRPDAALPIDQRAVAIETQHCEVAEPHRSPTPGCHCERSDAISRRPAHPAGDCCVAALLAMTYPEVMLRERGRRWRV